MSAAPKPDPGTVIPPQRLASLDAFRGFTMLLMASESLGIPQVARQFPESRFWQALAYQFDHAEWVGGGLWDMIQPSFSLMVGVSMAFSYAKRRDLGQSYLGMMGHAAWRSVVLIMLGVLLRSRWTFEDTLSQIGLGYFFLFLLWNRPRWLQVAALVAILASYGAWFATYPLPPPGFDPASVGAMPDFVAQHDLTGFAAHWNKNRNPAFDFEVAFLNVFPRAEPYTYNGGGYLTLSFIPTLGTMLIGLIAGEWLRGDRTSARKTGGLAIGGLALVILGVALHMAGLCPIVKRIWTPTWTLYSAGWALLGLALFHAIMDWGGRKSWAWPLTVVGMNSIAMYVMAHFLPGWIEETITGLGGGERVFRFAGETYAPIVEHALVLLVLWSLCWLLYRNRIFIRV